MYCGTSTRIITSLAISKFPLSTRSTFHSPSACAVHPVDHSILVIDTGNHAIRRIASSCSNPSSKSSLNNDTSNWVVTTVAGGGLTLSHKGGYRDGTGVQALFRSPLAVAYDPVTGHWLIADTQNHVLRQLECRVSTTIGWRILR